MKSTIKTLAVSIMLTIVASTAVEAAPPIRPRPRKARVHVVTPVRPHQTRRQPASGGRVLSQQPRGGFRVGPMINLSDTIGRIRHSSMRTEHLLRPVLSSTVIRGGTALAHTYPFSGNFSAAMSEDYSTLNMVWVTILDILGVEAAYNEKSLELEGGVVIYLKKDALYFQMPDSTCQDDVVLRNKLAGINGIYDIAGLLQNFGMGIVLVVPGIDDPIRIHPDNLADWLNRRETCDTAS